MKTKNILENINIGTGIILADILGTEFQNTVEMSINTEDDTQILIVIKAVSDKSEEEIQEIRDKLNYIFKINFERLKKLGFWWFDCENECIDDEWFFGFNLTIGAPIEM